MARLLALALVASSLFVAVSAHSWLDCANWKFNNPAALTTPSLRRWGDADGTCLGYPRRFQVGMVPFGKFDSVQFFRHYVQPFGSNDLACRRNAGTSAVSGSNEGLTAGTARTAPYAPNADPYGNTYGTWAKVYAGDTLCWRWPAKNHVPHVDASTNPVKINWDDVANRVGELTQAQMDTKIVATVLWANCPVPGAASSGDGSGVGSDLAACGQCFTVPARAPGTYTVQWKWPFKTGESETYTSCADIEVLSPTATTPVNCVVGAWGAWGICSTDCGGGTQTRSRSITTPQQGTGTACPILTSSQACGTAACTNFLSEHVVYADALAGFSDWSWATTRSLVSTAVTARGGSGTSMSFVPKAFEALYLHYDGELGAQIDMKDFQSISFYTHGGTTGGQSVTFSLVVTVAKSSPVFTYTIPTSKFVANTWSLVNIKFTDLGFTSGLFDGMWWQANGAATQGAVYIDDVYFMHVHDGGLPPVPTDPCASVTCSNRNSKCLAGLCVCTDGYSGTTCSVAPTVTGVTVKTLAGAATTALVFDQSVVIGWSTTGTIPTVSLVLNKAGSSIPIPLATAVTNSGTYTWMVPSTVVAGTYTITVSFTTTVKATSGSLTKAADVVSTCTDPFCSGHGECSDDTNDVCICRYGYTGTLCLTEPAGIIRLATSLVVSTPYSTANADQAAFKTLFRSNIANALKASTDQVEVKTIATNSNGQKTRVTFDLLIGGSFGASALSVTSAAALTSNLDAQLSDTDSSLNRGTQSFESGSQADTSAASSRYASSLVTASALLAAVAAIAL